MQKKSSDWEILSISGWKPFNGVSKSVVPIYVEILFENFSFKCSPTHKIKIQSGKFIDAIDVVAGTITSTGLTVLDLNLIESPLEVYDIRGVIDEEYLTSGLESHNCAFIENVDEIWKSASSTLSTGGKAILLSTPAGVGNFFHKKWTESVEMKDIPDADEKGIFNPIFLDWTVVPGRDQKWRDAQTVILGDKGARQEHDADFLATGNAVIDPDLQQWHRMNNQIVLDISGKGGFDGNLWRWQYPNPNRGYMVVADVARGDATDFSAFHVIDLESVEQIAEYKGKADTTIFADLLRSVATEYNDALIVVENANVGWAVLQRLIDKEYKNLYYTEKDHHYIENSHQKHRKREMVAGFTTSTRTRPLIISKLDEYMRAKDGGVIIHSERTYDELSTFIWNGSKAEAMTGYNDDLVMSLAIALWIRDTAIRLRTQGIALSRAGLNAIGRSESTGVYTANNINDPNKMIINGEEEDLSWLTD